MKERMEQKDKVRFLENLERQFAAAKEVKGVADKLAQAGFEPYLVGGCLRDLLLGSEPNDWDIATNASPEEIQKAFPDSVYENDFGTVAVKTRSENPAMKIVEVTTFRTEGEYTDKRHPDSVAFAETIEEDLSRRDFTINAIAYEVSGDKRRAEGLVDPFNGLEDLSNGVIRAVGDPEERFEEDALRLMRAVRFSGKLGFEIEENTAKAIKEKSTLLERIAEERVRDELTKLIMTENAADAVRKMEKLGLLTQVMPELCEGVEVDQNRHHIYTVFEHNVRALEYAAKNNFSFDLRLASLLHDVGKPKTKRGEGEYSTFYGHQVVGARMAAKILDRLHFPKKFTERVSLLVREHMFVHDPESKSEKGARRLLRRVGPENIDDLFKLREADRIGSGVPKAQPYRLRHLMAMIEKVQKDPISEKMLKIKGDEVMKILNMKIGGPMVGFVLKILLEEVLDDPSRNELKYLEKRTQELGKLPESELIEMVSAAKRRAGEAQDRVDKEIKDKYFVK